MTQFTRATMAGPLRNGAERGGGTVAHLIENSQGRHVHNLGRALCGKKPSITWSDWAPERLKICPSCAKKAEKIQSIETPVMDVDRMLSNAAVAAQVPLITDDQVVVGALLRSIAQWLEANGDKSVPTLLTDLARHPDYQS